MNNISFKDHRNIVRTWQEGYRRGATGQRNRCGRYEVDRRCSEEVPTESSW